VVQEPPVKVTMAVMPVTALLIETVAVVVVLGHAGETRELLAVHSLLAMVVWVVSLISLGL
jgi:hypothetical protein